MIKTKDFSSKDYPYRSLLTVNNELHSQLYSVIETFSDDNLSKKIKGYDRTIAEIVSHTITTHKQYFLEHLVLGKDISDYSEPEITSVEEALKMIEKNLEETNGLIETIDSEDLSSIFETEWGQKITKELAIWLGITQITLHLGEICTIAGNGGFYKGTLG